MLSYTDLLPFPFGPDLTQAGIACACRLLPLTYDPGESPLVSRLRHSVVQAAADLTFRRLLAASAIPYSLVDGAPFTTPGREHLILGGRLCQLVTFPVFQKDEIRHIRRYPDYLLEASALIPAGLLPPDPTKAGVLYVFSVVTALVTPRLVDVQRAMVAGQPIYLIHPFPRVWLNPKWWRPLNPISLKTDASFALCMELGGLDGDRHIQTEQLNLPPHQRILAKKKFYSLAYLHVTSLPDSRVGIHAPGRKDAYIISRHQWGNLWVYGMDIILLGYLGTEALLDLVHPPPAHSPLLRTARTGDANFILPLSKLSPLGGLFARVKEWAQTQNHRL